MKSGFVKIFSAVRSMNNRISRTQLGGWHAGFVAPECCFLCPGLLDTNDIMFGNWACFIRNRLLGHVLDELL